MDKKIKNENFEIGQTFKGDINQEIFEVVDIKTENNTKYIHFKAEKTGVSVPVNIKTAQRLLLTKI